MRTGVFLTGRNNYAMLDKLWARKVDVSKIKLINIDAGSLKEEKEKGKLICSKLNIPFLDNDESSLQHSVEMACDYFGGEVDYLLWFQHDCWPITLDFFNKFDNIVRSGKISQFGTVGFNVLATDVLKKSHLQLRKLIKSGKRPACVLGRSILSKYRWMSGYDSSSPILPRIGRYKFPFSVELVAYFAIAINVNNFRRHIKVDKNFKVFYAWDDLSFQFLSNNVHNLCIPSLYLCHNPEVKPKFGIPRISVKGAKDGNNKYADGWGHHDTWKNKWGWDFRKTKSFRKVRDRYKKTLIEDFYVHDYGNGPFLSYGEL